MSETDLERDLYPKLLEWKSSEDRKPLIIRGVRQCGKTYLMKQFGEREYQSVAYLEFEGNKGLCRIFDGDLDTKRLVMASHIVDGKDDPLFHGGFMENYVMCELTSYGCPGQGYWMSGNSAEVDFLVTCDEGVVPIEVKSGKSYRAASLKEYIDRYSPDEAIVISGKGPDSNNGVTTIPLYAIWMIGNILGKDDADDWKMT